MPSLPTASGPKLRGLIVALLVAAFGCHRPQLATDVKPPHSAFALRLSDALVGHAGAAPLDALVAEAERRLPTEVKQRIGRVVLLELDPSRASEPIAVPVCRAAATEKAPPLVQTLGVMALAEDAESPHRILLHPGLLAIAQTGSAASPQFACGHRSLYRLAVATLVHEVLHIYDRLARLSDDPAYQHLQQFAPQGAARKLLSRNQLRVRSPDIYEFHDIAENLAVNFEYFLLDPEFKCRRPAVYHYFATHLTHRPFAFEACAINTLVYAGNQPVYIDPARVYQIHYLFAARGKGIASRFGHSMFRIVSCAPSRRRVDESCLEDLHDQLVLSFVANLRDDLTIKAWKGLSGKYMSQLLIRPFTEILNDYTEIDHRDLESLPLRMSGAEIQQFLFHALELYWGYSGHYYFLTNNCADESLRLIQSVLSANKLQSLDILTPLGLRDSLIQLGIGDASVLADRPRALERGYRFQSAIERYEAVYQRFRPALPAAAPRTLDRYLKGTTAATRREWAQRVLAQPAALSGMFTVEGLILQRLMKDIERSILVRILWKRDERYAGLAQKLKDHLRSLRLPWELVETGYGIPLPQEFGLAPRSVRPGFPEEILTIAMSLIKSDDPTLYHEYVETEQNRRFLLTQILKSPAIAATPPGAPDPTRVGDKQ